MNWALYYVPSQKKKATATILLLTSIKYQAVSMIEWEKDIEGKKRHQKLTLYYVRVKQAIKHHEMEVTCCCTIFTTFVIVGEMWLVIQIHIYGAIQIKCACIFALALTTTPSAHIAKLRQKHTKWKSACDCGGGAQNRISITLYFLLHTYTNTSSSYRMLRRTIMIIKQITLT